MKTFDRAAWLAARLADAIANGTCRICFRVKASPGTTRCEPCRQDERDRRARAAARRPTKAKQPDRAWYVPLDEVLARPAVKALRALRRSAPDWVEFDELPLMCEVGDDDRVRHSFTDAIRKHVALGNIERRTGPIKRGCKRVMRGWYRITDKGRDALAAVIARSQPIAADFEGDENDLSCGEQPQRKAA